MTRMGKCPHISMPPHVFLSLIFIALHTLFFKASHVTLHTYVIPKHFIPPHFIASYFISPYFKTLHFIRLHFISLTSYVIFSYLHTSYLNIHFVPPHSILNVNNRGLMFYVYAYSNIRA